MYKYILNLVIILFLYSCTSSLKEVEYFPNSNVVSLERYYETSEDKELGNYLCILYDSIGNKKAELNYKNNQLNGNVYLFYSNGKLERSTKYINDVENGIVKIFTEKGNLVKEFLCLNGKDVIIKLFVEYMEVKSYGFRIYPLFEDTISEYDYEGRIIYDTNMKIVDSLTFYYQVFKKENIKTDSICLEIDLLGTTYDEFLVKKNLILGELNINEFTNERYSLLDTLGIYSSDMDMLELKLNKADFDNELVTGLLQLELYSQDRKKKIRDLYFTFYYDLGSNKE
jgi:hypothetical protein